MKTPLKSVLYFSAAFVAAVSATCAFAEQKSVVQFSNPSAPGRLVIQVGMGDVSVTGTDAKDVTIVSDVPNETNPEPRSDGLRRLDSDAGYSASEAGNVVTISLGSMFKAGRHSDASLTITAPRSTSITIERAGRGNTTLKGIAGDLEFRGAMGDVKLEDVSGGVLVESALGNVSASFLALSDSKPVSISAVNGDVTLRVPVRAKASVRFRTLRGEVLTDFSDKELVTRVENSGVNFSADVKVNVAVETATKAYARADADARRSDADQARASAEAARSAEASQSASAESPPAPPKPPKPPMFPKMKGPASGGSLVVGTLNGGGPELIVTAVNGTITLRKAQ